MQTGDIDGVVRIARIAFPDHFEDRACFAERHALYPEGCFVLACAAGDVRGYLIAYPWLWGSAPKLNSLIGALPDHPDVLYLHDLALHPDLQGRGHAMAIVEQLARQVRAEGWTAIALVAVNRAGPFWERLGFAAAADDAIAQTLASYGAEADYRVRRL